MKNSAIITIIRMYREDRIFRKKALIVLALVGLYVLIVPSFLWKQSAEKNLSTIRAKHFEFATVTGEYKSLRKHVNAIEQKRSLTKTDGLTQVIGDMTLSLGIKEKMKSIKVTGTRKIDDQMTEESAEIQMEKLNASQLVHLLYKIENAPMILSVTRVVVKKSFENPELLDVTTALSLFR